MRLAAVGTSVGSVSSQMHQMQISLLRFTLFENRIFLSDFAELQILLLYFGLTIDNLHINKVEKMAGNLKLTETGMKGEFEFPANFHFCLQTNFQLLTRSKKRAKFKLKFVSAFILHIKMGEIRGKLEDFLQCGL